MRWHGISHATTCHAPAHTAGLQVFGKALIQQPVIRNKLAGAIAALEAVQSYSENLTYTMCNAKDGPLGSALAG